jgi:hypothetical protein
VCNVCKTDVKVTDVNVEEDPRTGGTDRMIQLSSTRSDSWSIIPNKLSLSLSHACPLSLSLSLSQRERPLLSSTRSARTRMIQLSSTRSVRPQSVSVIKCDVTESVILSGRYRGVTSRTEEIEESRHDGFSDSG